MNWNWLMWPPLLLEFSQRCPNLFANLTSSLSGKTIPGGTHNAQPWHLFKRKCKRQNGADVIYPSTAELCFRWPIWSRWLPLVFLFFCVLFFSLFFSLCAKIIEYSFIGRVCPSVCRSYGHVYWLRWSIRHISWPTWPFFIATLIDLIMLTYLLYIFQALLLLLLNIPASVQFHFVNTCTHRRSTRHDFVGIFGLRLGSLFVKRARFSRHGESDRDCVGSFGRLRDDFRPELRVDGGLWRR